jgi:hypothetical protein
MTHIVGYPVIKIKIKPKSIARIIDTKEDEYIFTIKVDGKELTKRDKKNKEYSEVHPTCLSNK